jgi:hypothetical protein
MDLTAAVVTFDALLTVGANLDWLRHGQGGVLRRGGVKKKQAALVRTVKALP